MNKMTFMERLTMLMKLMVPHQKLQSNASVETLANWISELQESIENCFEEDVNKWSEVSDDEFMDMYRRLSKDWPRYVAYGRELAAEHYQEFGD